MKTKEQIEQMADERYFQQAQRINDVEIKGYILSATKGGFVDGYMQCQNEKPKNKYWKPLNTFLRIISFPLILALIVIKYNVHAIVNAICFTVYGGEWITYAKQDKVTMQDIYLQLKNNYKNDIKV